MYEKWAIQNSWGVEVQIQEWVFSHILCCRWKWQSWELGSYYLQLCSIQAVSAVWSPKERDAVDKEILHLAGLNYSQPSSITCPNIARFSRVQHPVHWAHLKICPLILVPNLSRALTKICLIQNPLRSMGVLNWHQWAMIPLLLWGKKCIRSKGGHSHTLHLLSCDGHEDFVHCCHPILKTLRGS